MKTILLLIFVLLTTICTGQVDTIKDANLIFERPNSTWHLVNIQRDSAGVIYWYKRAFLVDNEDRKIIPNIGFIIETLPGNMNLIEFSINKRAQEKYHIDSMFANDGGYPRIKLKNALGFLGKYKQDSTEHTIYVVYLIRKDKGIQIIMDITSELFAVYRKEFIDGLMSIKEF